MAIPDEYSIKEVVRTADNITVCRAEHPIHGTVAIYRPADALPSETDIAIKKHLYQSGIQMRSISQLYLPFVTIILEVSQNPNEPYIITEYVKYDLETLISEGVRLKPKRIYQIFSQVLQAVISLAKNGWQVDRLNPLQIKLIDTFKGDITFTTIGGSGYQASVTKTSTVPTEGKRTDTVTLEAEQDTASANIQSRNDTLAPTQEITNTIGETQALNNIPLTRGLSSNIEPTMTLSQSGDTIGLAKAPGLTQRNIYILGGIAYQLLFGGKYHLSDSVAAINIKKLGSKWRTILDKSLSPNLEDRYGSYETMLHDIKRVLSKNKRIAIAAAPLVVLLVIIGGYLGYKQYHQYKIMTSKAGQAIENFLSIVNKTDSDFPEPYTPESNDNTILKPFDDIAAAGKK